MPRPRIRDVTGYTRLVRGLTSALPLLALALLAGLFLLPRETRLDGLVIETSADLLALGEGLAVTRPRIAGSTAEGEPFVVTADRAVPDGPDPAEVTLERVRAEFLQAEGRGIVLSAEAGALRPKARTLSLSGEVALDTSDGYRVRTDRLSAGLDETRIVSDGAVQADGPPGHLTAGGMVLTGDPDRPGKYLLVFKGGVKLVYDPVK